MQILAYICTMQSQLDLAASASPEKPALPHHKVYGFAMNSTWDFPAPPGRCKSTA